MIAKVNGPAAGIGCSLALAADLVVAAESAYLLLAFVNVGLGLDGGASLTLPLRGGHARAFEMAYLGERVPAARALEWGLVNRVVADDDLDDAVAEITNRLAAAAPGALATIKRTINARLYAGLEEVLELETTLQQERVESADFARGRGRLHGGQAAALHGSMMARGPVGYARDEPRDDPQRGGGARTPTGSRSSSTTSSCTYRLLEGARPTSRAFCTRGDSLTGDRVGIMLPNVPYFPVCYFGVLRAGGVVVPMNVLLKRREVAFYLKDSGARLLFAWHGFAEDARAGADDAGAQCVLVEPGEFERIVGEAQPRPEMVDRAEGDTAVILYTSGTTGTPKGAELTHANLLGNCESARSLFDMESERVTLGALPLFHSFGQTCAMNATIKGGGTLTLLARFEPAKALEVIERDHVNVFEGVPTMYGAILHAPERDRFDASSLEMCASGGAAMPVELLRGSSRRSGARSSRDTGSPRPPRWPRSTILTASARRARSARRSVAWR